MWISILIEYLLRRIKYEIRGSRKQQSAEIFHKIISLL